MVLFNDSLRGSGTVIPSAGSSTARPTLQVIVERIALHNETEPAHFTRACVLLPPAGNWVRSACPIPPCFAVSLAVPMTSSLENLGSFWRFSVTVSPFPANSFGGYLLVPLFGTRSAKVSWHPTVRLTTTLQVTHRAAHRCEYCRFSQERREANFPIDQITPCGQGNATGPAHLELARVSLLSAGNWVRSACPIPP